MNSALSYGLLNILCLLVIGNDFKRRFFQKDRIRYRIVEKGKIKYVFYGLGLILPLVILISGFVLREDMLTFILTATMSLEMAVIWTIIELGDTLITKDVIGKGWYTRLTAVAFFDIQHYKNRPYLVFKKHKSRKQEMVWLNPDDVEPVRTLLANIHFSVK
jgi:uncharacterized MnhB-related membrane protein